MSVERISETVIIEGLKDVDEKLQQLDDKLSLKIVKAALKAGANVTYDAAEGTTPHRTGEMAAALTVRPGTIRKGYASVKVGFGNKWFSGDQFYAAFVEFGHKAGSRKLGDMRKVVPGEHPLEYAYDETKFAATQMVMTTALVLIEQAAQQGSTA